MLPASSSPSSSAHLSHGPCAIGWPGTEPARNRHGFRADRRKAGYTFRRMNRDLELDLLMQTLRDGVAMWDASGVLLHANEAYARIVGVPRGKLPGTSIESARWSVESREGKALTPAEGPLNRLLAGEDRVEPFEAVFVSVDGRRTPVRMGATAMRGADGKFLGSITNVTDLSDLQSVDAALRRKSAELGEIIEAMTEGLVIFDREGRITMMNAASEAMFGVPRAEAIGLRYDQVPWQRLDAAGKPLGAANHPFSRIKAGEERILGFELDLVSSGGKRRSLLANAVAQRDAAGRFAGVVGTMTDVTDRKRAAERAERALEASDVALFDIDVATGGVYLSESWSRIVGGPREETHTSSERLIATVHPDERERVWKAAMETLGGQRDHYEVEHRVRTVSGEWKWILSRARVLDRDAHGRATRVAGTNLDITDRKHAEQRIHYLATRDELTKLTNRAVFGARIAQIVEDARAHSERAALL